MEDRPDPGTLFAHPECYSLVVPDDYVNLDPGTSICVVRDGTRTEGEFFKYYDNSGRPITAANPPDPTRTRYIEYVVRERGGSRYAVASISCATVRKYTTKKYNTGKYNAAGKRKQATLKRGSLAIFKKEEPPVALEQ